MDQITLHWLAQSSAAFASRPRPIGGLMVTITPRKKIVEHNGVSVLMRPARGETDNNGVLVTMPLATEGIKIPDVDVIWDVNVSGSQHVTAFTFPIHPFGKGADQQLAELETLPTKPEDSELGLWLDIAADVLDSREAAEKALSEASEADKRAVKALAEAEAAIERAANTKGKDGDKGPDGDPGKDGEPGKDGGPGIPTPEALAEELSKPASPAYVVVANASRRAVVSSSSIHAGLAIRGTYSGFFDYSNEANNIVFDVANRFNVNTIQIVPNTYQENKFSNDVEYRTPFTISEVSRYVRKVHSLGYAVMLKPHVEVNTSPYVWRATIEPTDPHAWLDSYEEFILKYAKLCEDESVEYLCIGTEYDTMTAHEYSERWREIISKARKLYSGHITFGATFNTGAATTEAQKIDFWDVLDSIGLNVYVRVTPNFTDSKEVLKSYFNQDPSGNNMAHSISELSERWGKEVIYTEYGYPMNDADNTIVRNVADPLYSAYFARHISAQLESSFSREWFTGGYLWAIDSHDNISSVWGPGGDVEKAVSFAYARRNYSGLAAVNRSLLTRSAGGSAQWAKLFEITLPRLGVRSLLEFTVRHTEVGSTDPKRASVLVHVGSATSLASNASMKIDSPNWRTNEAGLVFNNGRVEVWFRIPPNGRNEIKISSVVGSDYITAYDRAEIASSPPASFVSASSFDTSSFTLSLPSGVTESANLNTCVREGRRVVISFDLQKTSFTQNEWIATIPVGARPPAAVFTAGRLVKADNTNDVVSLVALANGEIQLRHGSYVGGKAVAATLVYYTSN